MKSPIREVNHPFVPHIPSISHLVAISDQMNCQSYYSACVQVTFILFNDGPKT